MNPTKNFPRVRQWFRGEFQSFYSIEGTLVLSDYELVFYATDSSRARDMHATYASVDLIDRNAKNYIFVFFKDFQQWVLSWDEGNPLDLFAALKEKCAPPTNPSPSNTQNPPPFTHTEQAAHQENILAFYYRLPYTLEEDGWLRYDEEREIERLFFLIDNEQRYWKKTYVNNDYKVCATYPRVLVIPKAFEDEELIRVAEYRDEGRVPVLSWIHPTTLAAICRCSQPLPGRLGRTRSPPDEKLITDIFATNPRSRGATSFPEHYIIDARSFQSAAANQVRGAGFERAEFYGGCQVEFLGIGNIHTVRESLERLQRLCRAAANRQDRDWLTKLDETSWLRHISDILRGSIRIASLVHSGATVVVHCTHGWDRTTQLVSLSELMLDRHYRTLRGFEELIEKEWCAFGHRFDARCGRRIKVSANGSAKLRETSPIFLQFVDCVWQLMQQFPTQFEFNERFLLVLLEHVYSCRFGTFLYNSDKERTLNQVKRRTTSLWSYTNYLANMSEFLNPAFEYDDQQQFLPAEYTPSRLLLWTSLYCRYEIGLSSAAILQKQMRVLKQQNVKLTAEFKALTTQYNELKSKYTQLEKAYQQVLQNIQPQSQLQSQPQPQSYSLTSPDTISAPAFTPVSGSFTTISKEATSNNEHSV
jgi:hypothetical protein